MLVSEHGSIKLQFTDLGQITANPRYDDAVQRLMDVFDEQRDETKLPGILPVVINMRDSDFKIIALYGW